MVRRFAGLTADLMRPLQTIPEHTELVRRNHPRPRSSSRSPSPTVLFFVAFTLVSILLANSRLRRSLREYQLSNSSAGVEDYWDGVYGTRHSGAEFAERLETWKPYHAVGGDTLTLEAAKTKTGGIEREEEEQPDEYRVKPNASDAYEPTEDTSKLQATEQTNKPTPIQPNRTQPGQSPGEMTGGIHTCTCLKEGSSLDATLPKKLRWLHFPKTGTSFISTLWSYTTTTPTHYIDLNINSHVCSMHDSTSFSMYDFALMRRYPWEMYGARNIFNKTFASETPLGLVGGTQHMPLTPEITAEYRQSKQFDGLVKAKKLKNWGSEIANHNHTVVAFFRQPEARIVSAWYDGRHANGLDPEQYKKLLNVAVQRASDFKCQIGENTYINPLECFARYPGIGGCMTRMLTGETCADGVFESNGLENLPLAIEVLDKLGFVGIMEDWNESICQFHKKFGFKYDETGNKYWPEPLQGEFSNVHQSKKKKTLDLKDMHGYKDIADGVLYEAAKLKFERMVGRERCHKYQTFEELTSQSAPDRASICRPKSCSDLGKQCGEWDNGCGRTVICGMCDSGRTGLPTSWRTQCIEGQCIDYCPPWDQKNMWHISDKTPAVMRDMFNSPIIRGKDYLTPSDAVVICANACNQNLTAFSGMCRCGLPPKIITYNLTLSEFKKAHDLTAKCSDSNARKFAKIAANETQPICCKPLDPKGSHFPAKWKRMYVMGGPNFEGEYFDHVPVRCDGFEDCEANAAKKKAEMVIYDVMSNMCHLMRNVFELEGKYPVTKDNQNRYILDMRIKNNP